MRVQGFTLIELMVSVAVLLILTGTLVAGYNRFTNSQVLRQAAATLKANLRAASAAAISGVKPEGCDTLVGYEVNFPSPSSYTSSAVCIVGGTTQAAGATASYTLPAAVRFSPVPSPIIFYAVNNGSSAEQTITLSGAGKSIQLTVSISGVVSDVIPTPTPTPTPSSPQRN